MQEVVCYWLEPTDRVHLFLRRYRGSHEGGKCPGRMSYHNAMADFGIHPIRYANDVRDGHKYIASYDDLMPPREDPRWPQKCECGYVFEPAVMEWCDSPDCQIPEKRHKVKKSGDENQVFVEQIYKRADTGQELLLDDAPVGAMWNAWWMGEPKYADKIQLMVKLPNGSHWWVDGPASNSPGWTRTGTVPVITAQPSIWAGQGKPNDYHGWLRAGKLVKC